MKYKNETRIPMSVAVWLAHDTYDQVSSPNYISATGLLRPIKSIILSKQIQDTEHVDISDLIQSRLGTATHTAIEEAWKTNPKHLLQILGYPKRIYENVRVNPVTPLKEQDIPIYMEIRGTKEIDGYNIGGKFDFVLDGQLEDFKTTMTYNWISQSNKDSYIMQGSIYRWLHPEIITKDVMMINYIFNDWTAIKAVQDPKYPQSRVIAQPYPLLPIDETELWIKEKLYQISKYSSVPQEQMPECTKEELWQRDSVYKYYKDPTKTARSTKNFSSLSDANSYMLARGEGKVIEVPGEVKRCRYCPAMSVCKQAESLQLTGLLK